MPSAYRTPDELSALRDRAFSRAVEHGGVFRRSDLAAWGIDGDVLLPMVRRRWWVRLHHGVYTDIRRLEGPAESVERHLLDFAAGLRALPEPAFAFGSTSAALHELPLQRGLLSHVQLIRNLGSDGRALRRRITSKVALKPARIRSHQLAPHHLTVVRGLPTVSRALAAVSTAALSRREWALATLDGVAWQNPSAVHELEALIAEWSHLGGIGTAREVLPLVRVGAQTPIESLSRIRLLDVGLPEPRLQVPLYDRSGLIGYVDMLWDDLGVVGEADGLQKYGSREVLVAEKVREDRIRACGYGVVRWTWAELMSDPEAIAAQILRAANYGYRRAR